MSAFAMLEIICKLTF